MLWSKQGKFNVWVTYGGDSEESQNAQSMKHSKTMSTWKGVHIKMQQETADSEVAGNCPATGLVQ